tara:strand:- start:601 stop:1188 length:588 start_codon:yes stop_codon:yes gene_type:complete
MEIIENTLLIKLTKEAKFSDFKITQVAQLVIYKPSEYVTSMSSKNRKNNKENLMFDVEYIDDIDVTYLDKPIEDFTKVKYQFKNNMGIDLDMIFGEMFCDNFNKDNLEIQDIVEKVSPMLTDINQRIKSTPQSPTSKLVEGDRCVILTNNTPFALGEVVTVIKSNAHSASVQSKDKLTAVVSLGSLTEKNHLYRT